MYNAITYETLSFTTLNNLPLLIDCGLFILSVQTIFDHSSVFLDFKKISVGEGRLNIKYCFCPQNMVSLVLIHLPCICTNLCVKTACIYSKFKSGVLNVLGFLFFYILHLLDLSSEFYIYIIYFIIYSETVVLWHKLQGSSASKNTDKYIQSQLMRDL